MTNTTDTALPEMPMGIPGFTYADLHDCDRLASLYERFCEEVQAVDAPFWAEWDAYRQAPDAPRSPIALSSLLTRMAPHVSRFLERLFDVGTATSALRTATHKQDDLFRFKVDFVRRRALPLLKGAAHQAHSAVDDEVVQRLAGVDVSQPHAAGVDVELAVAQAGCRLLDGEKIDKAAVADDIEALKRWCAARIHDAAYHRWVVFRFPENLEPWHLVPVERVNAAIPEQMIGPDAKLRRRDGFKLTDLRATRREVLSEINYCVLCHERDKDSCSKGYREAPPKGSDAPPKIAINALGIELNGCPLDEKISEMHMLRKGGDAIGASRAHRHRQPDGSGHRSPHLQRLHEGVHLPEAGACEHPADGDRHPDRCAEDAVGCRDLRPAHAVESAERAASLCAAVQRHERSRGRSRTGRLHARALPRERRLRCGRCRRAQSRATPRRHRRHREQRAAAHSELGRDLSPAGRARARRVRRCV
ncbi:MAG: hypothetical protein QM736_23635 [Vicinamibacterales bacterium]